jgi:hypothetical protein
VLVALRDSVSRYHGAEHDVAAYESGGDPATADRNTRCV